MQIYHAHPGILPVLAIGRQQFPLHLHSSRTAEAVISCSPGAVEMLVLVRNATTLL